LNPRLLHTIFSRSGVALLFTGCLLLPLVSRLILRLPDLAFTNFTDAVFYLSYSQSFQDLFLRHGFIYYASRFGAIFPDAVAFTLFGPVDGPVILRLFLACVVSGVLFLAGKIRYNLQTGLFASLVWSFQPVFARLWCTTYLDSTAVPFLILAGGILFLFEKSSAAAFFAGILLAFAATSHLYVAILAFLLIPLVIGWRWESLDHLIKVQAPWFLGGCFFTVSAAYYWYSINCSIGAFWQPTVELMSDMSAGGVELWKKSLLAAILETPLWLASFLFLGCGAFFWKNGSPAWKGAMISLFLSTLFFWAGDLLGGAYALSVPFYFSFLGPVFLFFLIVFLGELNMGIPDKKEQWIFMFLSAVIVCLPMILKAQTQIPWLIVVALILFGAIVLVRRMALYSFPRILALGSLLAFSTLTLATGFYSQFLADVRIHYPKDKKIPELAYKLKQMLPPASHGDVIRFWYPSGEEYSSLKMLQSFFLHSFSLLPGEKGFARYPNLASTDADVIRRAGVQQIVVLDSDPQRLRVAVNSLSEAGLKVSLLQTEEMRLGKEVVFCQRLALANPPVQDRIILPLPLLKPSKAAGLSLNGATSILTTSDTRWNFDLLADLEEVSGNADALTFTARVLTGRVEVCLLDERGELVSAVEIWPTEKPISRILSSQGPLGKSQLMIRNKMPDSSRSKVEFSDIFLCTTEKM
jgi:hypothetical protein